MSVNVTGLESYALNWGNVLSAVNPQESMAKIDALNICADAGKVGLTFTVNDGAAVRTEGLSMPALDSPESVDEGMIASFCAKLGEESMLSLTDGQVKAFCSELTAQLKVLGESLEASSTIADSKASQAVLFDIYALMAILVECGQKMRDAARDVRQAENVLVQKTFQNQADMQRTAALTGLVCSVVVCAVQVGMQIGNMVYQGKGFAKQMDAYKRSGNDGMNAPMGDAEYAKGMHMENRARMFGDMIAAIGNVAQGCVSSMSQMISAEATEESAEQQKAQEMLDQAKDLFSQCQSLIDSVIQLMRAVLQAEVQSMRDAIHA